MADDNDSLLREVEEELRRERMQKFWERYNGLIIGAAALLVVGVGGYNFLEHRRIAAAEKAGAEFSAAMQLGDDSKTEEAKKAFDAIVQSGPAGYASLARLHVAGGLARDGKTDEAIAAYEAVAKDSNVDSLLKNFAQLQIASLQLGNADFTEVQNRLTPLARDDSPFKTTAQEFLGAAALKAGKTDEARKYLEPLLLDVSATRGLQERVKIMMAKIARAETAKDEPAKPAAAPQAGDTKAAAPESATPAEAAPANKDTDNKAPEQK